MLIFKAGSQARLAQEALDMFLFLAPRFGHELECNRFAEGKMGGAIDIAHATVANQFNHLARANARTG